jgi:Xaa-Pro aminopeptidase
MFNRERALKILDEKEIDVVVATTPENVYYTSGLWSLSHWLLKGTQVYVVLSRDDLEPVVIMPKSDVDLAADLPNRVAPEKVRPYGTFFFNKGDALDTTEKEILDMAACEITDSPMEILVKTLKDMDSKKIAIDTVNVRSLKTLDADIVEGSSVLQEIRMVKTDKEIAALKTSFKIVEKAIFKCLKTAKEGMSEKELATTFEKIVYENGGNPAFTVIGFGKRSAFPNVQPSDKKLKKGEVIRFDVGCVYNKYYSDMSRIASCGTPCQKYQDYYAAVVAGEEEALQTIRQGVSASRVFQAAVDTVKKGIPHFERHHIGHGIGLELYDPPSLAEHEAVLEENMVLCVETPYYEIGFAGVQIEDAVVVTKNGYELITQSEKDMYEVITCT